jgi:osmoprotectant transport system permease protein
MSFLADVYHWFADGDHWTGNEGILHRLTEHVQLSAASIVVAAVIALPVGLVLGHLRKGGLVAINVSNIGRALPSFALLILAVQIFGIGKPAGWLSWVGSLPTFIALVALAVPPVLTNAYVGMAEVDSEVREAARGMGMSGHQLLSRVELPMALPLLMAGVRTAAVAVVATAGLAAYIGWGGLGRFIFDGFATQDYPQMFAGALLVALLSIAFELGLGVLQRMLVSRGLRVGGEKIAREIDAMQGAVVPPPAPASPAYPGR